VSLSRALLVLGCAAFGCSSSAPVTTHAAVDPGLRLSALVLTPVRDTAATDTTALGQRLTAVALEAVGGEAMVFAGAEVQYLHPERRDWTATSAVPLLRAAGLRPEQAVVVEARVDSGQAASQQEVQGKGGGSAVGAAAELHWRATVEVLLPSSGQTLVETSAEANADPFSGGGTEAAKSQPGAVLEKALAEALAQLRATWTPPREPRGPQLLTWTVVPAPEGKGAHGLDAEVLRLQLLQTANPGLDEEEAAHLARLPPGVLVRASPLGFRLRAEDLVLSINGAPANAASLARCRFATTSTLLEVRSPDGHSRRVNFP
jgi:hypothetical protein